MAKKAKETVDYSKLSLPEIIKIQTKREVSFFELDIANQREVLNLIEQNKLDIKIIDKKWFDILTGKFYCTEIKPSNEWTYAIGQDKKEFNTFGELYEYVKGDIYENSCFYGYAFSDREIGNYGLNKKLLSRKSLTDSNIKSFSFASIEDLQKNDTEAKRRIANEVVKWVEECEPISTLEDLETKQKQFLSEFHISGASRVFFSMVVRKYKEIVKEAVIEFVCKHDRFEGIGFNDVLLIYGRDSALRVIENYRGICSYATSKKHVAQFKRRLQIYDQGDVKEKRRLGFDPNLQLYYAGYGFFKGASPFPFLDHHEYFGSFEEFVSYTKGDLRGANLSAAPIAKEEILGYQTDSRTSLPLPRTYDIYEVKKAYSDGKFVVEQRWLNDGFVVQTKKHEFDHFFDFVYFLNGDLSDADLLLCEGIENIGKLPNLNLKGIIVRSEVAEKLGLPIKLIGNNELETKSFASTNENEIETSQNFLIAHPEDDDYSGKVSYISDIHLLHRFEAYKCRTPEDVNYVIRTIAKTLSEQATGVNAIAGDTSSDFKVFKVFISKLAHYRKGGDFFFTLGNHELWGLNDENLPNIVDKYKKVLKEKSQGNMHLVQNNLFYKDGDWKEMSEDELSSVSTEHLRTMTRSATIAIFGGIGFAGTNEDFNANNGIYMDVLTREEEKFESAKFLSLYEKVTTALKGKNLVVLTHMPMRDWGGKDIHAKEGVVYINGHSHRNFYYDDGKKRIYADNQVGYHGKNLSFKQVAVDFNYDWFADYKDGLYEITKEDYEQFYRGIGEYFLFNRPFEKLFMIKREETYMFLMKTPKGSMLILNGGAIRRAGNHTLEYFYENLSKYSKSVSLFLSNYERLQKQVSEEIRQFGGDGRIHGSIVDIDFFNHLYLNPVDGTITPYFAYSMVDKYVYENLPSLLKYRCPKLFANYESIIRKQSGENALALYNGSVTITDKTAYVYSTEMYRISRILKGLQYTTKYNVVRLWNDSIVGDPTKDNGRLIVKGIIDPGFRPSLALKPDKKIHKAKSKSFRQRHK